MVDRKAANALLNVKHWPARFCDLWHLIPIEKMGDPTSKLESFPRRTETDMKKVPWVVLYLQPDSNIAARIWCWAACMAPASFTFAMLSSYKLMLLLSTFLSMQVCKEATRLFDGAQREPDT